MLARVCYLLKIREEGQVCSGKFIPVDNTEFNNYLMRREGKFVVYLRNYELFSLLLLMISYMYVRYKLGKEDSSDKPDVPVHKSQISDDLPDN